MKTLIIIPTYNESHNIKPMIEELLKLYPYDLLFIDDNSPDGTADIIKEYQQNDRVHLIERPHKEGLGKAYKAGFGWALEQHYEIIIEMDCDFSHSPLELPSLLAPLENYDFVIGSRYLDGVRVINWPLWRLGLSKFASHYVRTILRLPLTDPTSGFKAFRKETLKSLNLSQINSNGYAFQFEVNYRLWKQGLSMVEVPITFYERFENRSKMGPSIIIEACLAVFKLRWG